MEENLQDQGYRQKIIQEIRGNENNERSEKSLEEYDVFKGNI